MFNESRGQNGMEAPRVLIGSTPRVRQVLQQIEKVGRSRWPILVLGETGTGKELIARTIHRRGPIGPFVVIDCSSIVGPLIESELFGHAKGAFTGAVNAKAGLIEMANGGTAFFDEIGELPLDVQAKLLRVLQEKEFRPVGSVHTRKSDFRVISATNRELAQEVERGKFRRDLFYRLNVITLRLPALRERKEDIPELISYFVERYGLNHTVTEDTLDALVGYDWPGNVRELENCIQHMVAVNSGPFLHTRDLPSTLLNSHAGMTSGLAHMAAAVGQGGGPSGVKPLPELERQAIRDALDFTKGDRTTAAALLGIGRTTLYRKIKDYDLDS